MVVLPLAYLFYKRIIKYPNVRLTVEEFESHDADRRFYVYAENFGRTSIDAGELQFEVYLYGIPSPRWGNSSTCTFTTEEVPGGRANYGELSGNLYPGATRKVGQIAIEVSAGASGHVSYLARTRDGIFPRRLRRIKFEAGRLGALPRLLSVQDGKMTVHSLHGDGSSKVTA